MSSQFANATRLEQSLASGDLAAAIGSAQALISAGSAPLSVHLKLIACYLKSDRYPEACDAVVAAAGKGSKNPNDVIELARRLLQFNEPGKLVALSAKLLSSPVWNAQAEADLAVLVSMVGEQKVAARAAFEAIAAGQPGAPHVAIQLLRVAEAQGRYRDAHALATSVPAGPHGNIETDLRLAQGLVRHGESLAAITLLRQLMPAHCDDSKILQELTQLAIILGETQFARQVLDRLEALRPGVPGVVYHQGVLDVFSGDLTAAEAAFERCLKIAPDFAQAHWSISKLRRQAPGSNHVDRIRNLLGKATGSNVPSLAFALFKELDDLGEFKDAWAALEQGCRAKRASLNYRQADDQAGFQALRKLADEGYFSQQRPAFPQSGPTPIFILGLPRSGSTVLEQLLGAHPDVKTAGELPDFAAQMRWVANRYSRSQLDAELIAAMAGGNDQEVGARYLERTQWRAQGRTHFIDKSPLNFVNIGFILNSIPNAKVIHVRKSPMDACFSNLKELFTRMYPHSYQLDEMADYYLQYNALMTRWRSLDPGARRIVEVDYEGLVTSPESTMRSVLSALGIPWCADCSGLGLLDSDVTTASAAQVREPLHARAVGQWKNYAQWLGPLLDKVA